jgi:hypothetical protein
MGKIKNIPVDLMTKWAAIGHEEQHIQRAVEEAEVSFYEGLFFPVGLNG